MFEYTREKSKSKGSFNVLESDVDSADEDDINKQYETHAVSIGW
jgi:hypothetical protein